MPNDLSGLSTAELLERAQETISLCRLRTQDAEGLIPELARRLELEEARVKHWRHESSDLGEQAEYWKTRCGELECQVKGETDG